MGRNRGGTGRFHRKQNRRVKDFMGRTLPKGGIISCWRPRTISPETLFTVTAGQSKILEPVYSPSTNNSAGYHSRILISRRVCRRISCGKRLFAR